MIRTSHWGLHEEGENAMEVLSGLIGAIIGAAVALLAALLPLRAKRQEESKRINEVAVQILADTYSFLRELGEYLEDGPPLDEGTIEEVRKDRKLVRKDLAKLRQLYPEPDVRHDAERLSEEIDRSVNLLDPDPGEEERTWAIVTKSWHDASEIVEDMTRRLRADRRKLDGSFRGSQTGAARLRRPLAD